MTTPFAIEIFSVTGDPEGIRVISKTNWSGIGVAFPRSQLTELKAHDFIRDYMKRAGIYVLIGDLAEQTVYVGEADPVMDRLKQHQARTDWQWAVFFVDALHGLGKTEVQFLEAELLQIAHERKTAIILNKNRPTHPNMSPSARAAVHVFLNELLSIVPLIGIKAFSTSKLSLGEATPEKEVAPPKTFDTIIVPAHQDGFNEVFIGENCWYAIKIQAKYIPQIRYIAAYVTAPVSAITHVAEVSEIAPYEDGGKWIVRFKKPAVKIGPIPLGGGGIEVVPRSPRYTKYDRLLKAKTVSEVWAG
jgi:hypothetical protein